ncbi:MoaD/ThiS family protein [Gaetbulibacter sp. M235]|uniref:MoaD/ThiS family protein n=1 Tax=Gaetbulibacter sp. M235 TaxID=3126510 RepID=UPI00374E5E63
MKINIKYFGLLSEVTNCNEEIIDFSGNHISGLLEILYSKYPALKNKDFQVAQNHELVPFETKLTSNEIVLLPPFSGG